MAWPLTGVLLAWAGCGALEYEPEGEHFVEVPTPSSGVTITLGTGTDTLHAWGQATVRYGLGAGGPLPDSLTRGSRTLVRLEAYIGDRLLREGREVVGLEADVERPDGRFDLVTTALGDGVHRLRLVAYVRSGTGSLADALEVEAVTGEQAAWVAVDNAAPAPLDVEELAPEGGRLTLRWAPYRRRNFEEYEIFERTPNGLFHRTTLEDQGQAAWSDPLYSGGLVRYVLRVRAAGRAADVEREYEAPPPQRLRAERVDAGRVRVTWARWPFIMASSGAYLVLERYIEGAFAAEVMRTWSIADTAAVDDVERVFGGQLSYRLEHRGSHGSSSQTIAAEQDERLDFSNVVYLAGSHAYVGVSAEEGGSALVRRNAQTLAVEASAPPAVAAASPSGQWLVAVPATAPYVLWDLDPRTLAVRQALDMRTLLGYPAYINRGTLAVSDEGLVGFDAPAPPSGGSQTRGVVVVDLVTGRAVRETAYNDRFEAIHGRHVLTSRASTVLRWRVEADAVVPETSVNAVSPARFLPGGAEFVATQPGRHQLSVFHMTDGTAVRILPAAPSVTRLDVDPATGLLASLSTERLVAVEPTSGQVVASVPLAVRNVNYRFAGGNAWGGGYYRRLVDTP